MDIIIKTYEECTFGWKLFAKDTLYLITIVLPVICIIALAIAFKVNYVAVIIFAYIAFAISITLYYTSISLEHEDKYKSLIPIIKNTLIETRVYHTFPRFLRFYSNLDEVYKNKTLLLEELAQTRELLKRETEVHSIREAIFNTPRRQSLQWVTGISIATFFTLFVFLNKNNPEYVKSFCIAVMLLSFYLVLFIHSFFGTSKYNEKYRLLELINFIDCSIKVIKCTNSEPCIAAQQINSVDRG